ncbi:SET domain [Trypanosoma melophagium]|uniref:SET domain n=1 Tax=Trypanosoma melophagium TaxID=715481 RepID=UPI00351A4F3B|nr:SET domain [Trypanosoma melophagium]
MWRHLLRRLDIVLHPELRREVVTMKPIHGIFCSSGSDGIDEGELLCCVPFFNTIATNIAVASPWGTELMRAISSYSVMAEGVQVDYSKESAITTVFCALVMLYGNNALSDYLQWISLEKGDRDEIRRKLGDDGYARLQTIEKLNNSIILALCKDAVKIGSEVPVEVMDKAHKICSSRCVDVPRSHKIFGGPSLVPFLDLINHSEKEPNVAVYIGTVSSLRDALCESKKLTKDVFEKVNIGRCPFFVIVRAAKDIAAGEELHYQYVDAISDSAQDLLFWVSRFQFCP